MGVARPALKYFGSKWRIAPWIVEHLPRHNCYVEVFGGSAGVLLRKPRSRHEVVNDIDEEVMNFFAILRDRLEDLERAIVLTPYSRAESRLALEPSDDPLERARRYYIRSWQSYGGVQNRNQGWSFCFRGRRTRIHEWLRIDHLVDLAERLRGVQFDCDSWDRILPRYDTSETVFYLDPPYLPDVRANRYDAAYRHELGPEDHEVLLEAIGSLEGMVVLSGYDSPMYTDVLGAWRRVKRPTVSQGGAPRTEVLWLSPNCTGRLSQAWLEFG